MSNLTIPDGFGASENFSILEVQSLLTQKVLSTFLFSKLNLYLILFQKKLFRNTRIASPLCISTMIFAASVIQQKKINKIHR